MDCENGREVILANGKKLSSDLASKDFFKFNKLFRYENGLLWWREKRRGVRSTAPVGTRSPAGYVYVSVDRVNYAVHRVVWLLNTGNWPVNMIDHIDRIKWHNKFENLRDATRSENMLNSERKNVRYDSSTGVLGVTETKTGLYVASRYGIRIGGFRSLKKAKEAYDNFSRPEKI